jgi:hypothetical protein
MDEISQQYYDSDMVLLYESCRFLGFTLDLLFYLIAEGGHLLLWREETCGVRDEIHDDGHELDGVLWLTYEMPVWGVDMATGDWRQRVVWLFKCLLSISCKIQASMVFIFIFICLLVIFPFKRDSMFLLEWFHRWLKAEALLLFLLLAQWFQNGVLVDFLDLRGSWEERLQSTNTFVQNFGEMLVSVGILPLENNALLTKDILHLLGLLFGWI